MKIFDNIILDGYESKELKRYDDEPSTLPPMVAFENLPNLSPKGVLIANQYIDGRLMQIYTPDDSHALIISATGGGKTTSFVIPQVISFARQETKKSMIISDPKGEIYKHTAKYLEAQGYRVYLLNYRDPDHSEYWNPLTPIYRQYQIVLNIEKEVEDVCENGTFKKKFRGKIYDIDDDLKYDLAIAKENELDKVGNMIDEIASMMISVESSKDKVWEYGAIELLKAFLWAMLEDSDEKTRLEHFDKITEDTYSLRTIFRIFASFNPLNDYNPDNKYFSKRDKSSPAYIYSRSTMDCARATRSSYTSTFLAKLIVFKNAIIQTITSCNSFELSELLGGKVAVFIDYQDEIKTHYQLISLFVQSAYKFLIEEANKNPNGRLDTPFYFILDEFGNFPPITDFDTAITAARGRGIFFCCILQSYAQLDNVYGQNTAGIIRDNLNVKIFLGSNNPHTLELFQKECGDFTRISPLSALNGSGAQINDFRLETIPVVTRSALSSFKAGECVVTQLNVPYVLWSKLERCFLCDEFSSIPKANDREYKSKVNPYEKRYIYRIPNPNNSDDDDDLF